MGNSLEVEGGRSSISCRGGSLNLNHPLRRQREHSIGVKEILNAELGREMFVRRDMFVEGKPVGWSCTSCHDDRCDELIQSKFEVELLKDDLHHLISRSWIIRTNSIPSILSSSRVPPRPKNYTWPFSITRGSEGQSGRCSFTIRL